jgi:uncharacterized integral membrane protein (TIGR00697 family)
MKIGKESQIAIVSSLYVAAQMLADITAVRVVMLGSFAVDAGTFVYPFTFTLRDMVHKVAGIKVARVLIVVAAIVNLLMALFFQFVAMLPPDMRVGSQEEFGMVLAPLWRIVWASIIAEIVSEFTDGEIYQRWVDKIGTRYQWVRVLVSNSVSVPLDSILFVTIAFYGVFPNEVLLGILVANIVIKFIVTLVSMPWIYAVKGE